MTTETTVDTITFTVPLPPKAAHPNGRAHWRLKAAATAEYRERVYYAALEAMGGVTSARPHFARAAVHLCYRTRRPQDLDNLTAWSKALLDTLCRPRGPSDYTPRLGIIPDDAERYLTLTVTREPTPRDGEPGVTVTVTRLEAAT